MGIDKEFTGDKKIGDAPSYALELKIANKLLPKIPLWLETYHLTMLTLVWSALIVLFSCLAKDNINWLWLSSLMIFFQYVTDLLDGKLGKARNTGLVRWGYYMDHFLDYVFLCAIVIGYAIILPGAELYALVLSAIFGLFMVNAFLFFSATNKFRIHFFNFGPTEGRAFFILLNILIIFFGKEFLEKSLPFLIIFSLLILIAVVFNSQKQIWRIDMDNKN